MEIREQLQRTLGGAYTLERELGGGGMSQVFVVEETALGRKVVEKVLSPGRMGDVNIERFEREIQVARRLQHAHIVPVLTAGETTGLPFYTMPFVDGESLRARLGKGPLSTAETVNILRDVARAYYRKVIDLWKNADPELQIIVNDLKARARRLTDLEGVPR